MKKVLFVIGVSLDWLHLPGLITLTFIVLIGVRARWLSPSPWILLMSGTFITQGYLHTCPLNWVVYWLKKPYDPKAQIPKTSMIYGWWSYVLGGAVALGYLYLSISKES